MKWKKKLHQKTTSLLKSKTISLHAFNHCCSIEMNFNTFLCVQISRKLFQLTPPHPFFSSLSFCRCGVFSSKATSVKVRQEIIGQMVLFRPEGSIQRFTHYFWLHRFPITAHSQTHAQNVNNTPGWPFGVLLFFFSLYSQNPGHNIWMFSFSVQIVLTGVWGQSLVS